MPPPGAFLLEIAVEGMRADIPYEIEGAPDAGRLGPGAGDADGEQTPAAMR